MPHNEPIHPGIAFSGWRSVLVLSLLFSGLESSSASGSDSHRPVVSLSGDTLRAILLSPAVLEDRQVELLAAQSAYDSNPDDPNAIIWLGRRTAYLGWYWEAIDIFTAGIDLHPTDARMYRHRGHRYITVRAFGLAISDLTRAAELTADSKDEIEPDGLPNALNIPTSTLQSNIWYHLGLVKFLTGDFTGAEAAYAECAKRSNNNDMLVATLYWYYITLQRLGRSDQATALLDSIHPEMQIIENDSYFKLLLFYRGDLEQEELSAAGSDGIRNATLGYGLASWMHFRGNDEEAAHVLTGVLGGGEWAAFGYIAAEAELSRAR